MKGTQDLVWLGEPECEKPESVGSKAAVLSRLLRRGFNVPLGFCLTKRLIEKAKERVVMLERCSDLESAFTSLSAKSESGMIIVRSSAIVEDIPGQLFPGRFVSVGDVTCIEDLLRAIERCMESVKSKAVRDYCDSHGVDPGEVSMCVLVQEQIDPEYAGVCSVDVREDEKAEIRTLVEFVKGRSAGLLHGEFPSFVVCGIQVEENVRIKWLQGSIVDSDFGSRELSDLIVTACKLRSECSCPYVIEWAFKNDRFNILQVRSLEGGRIDRITRTEKRTKREEVTKEVLPGEGMIGLKGAAMKLFRDKGWFSKRVMFLEPQSNLNEFVVEIMGVDWGEGGVTVRFSHANKIGLPRAFFKVSREAAHFLEEVWRPEWFGIVHEYIDVKSSFELYVGTEHAVLEHMPGLWESNNLEPPDVVIFSGEVVQMMGVCKSRVSTYISPEGSYERRVNATRKEAIEEWSMKVQRYLDEIRTIFNGNLPVICHFVGDERGDWQFLNVRRTGEIGNVVARGAEFHIIREVSDFGSWNKKDPLLLQVAVARGREGDVLEVARKIPNGQTVYVDSGILSHPAMVLRELGISVMPVYLTHKRYQFQIEE